MRGKQVLYGSLLLAAVALGAAAGSFLPLRAPAAATVVAAATAVWQEQGALPEAGCPASGPVVIDPGHGGIDGGTNIPGMLEKEIVLDVALRTKRYLEQQGVPVILTRTADVDLGGRNDSGRLKRDLAARSRIANQCRATLFVSLHVNFAANRAERGMMLFYQGSRSGRDAAYVLQDALQPLHVRRERPYPRDSFAVLNANRAPAVLVELGFLSNPQDRALLAQERYREQVSQSLASACTEIYQKWTK